MPNNNTSQVANAPMPTRQLSNKSITSLYSDDDEDECMASPSAPLKASISAISDHTAATADETESSAEMEVDTRRIRFSLTVKKYLVESHKLYSDTERAATWYSPDEKAKRTSKVEKIVARLEAGKIEKRSSPYRGLYCWTEKGSAELEQQIFATMNAVMDEQDLQWDNSIQDEQRIADISQKVTAKSADKALEIADKDAQTACLIYSASDDCAGLFKDDDSSVGSMASAASRRAKKRRAGRKKDAQVKPRRTKRKGSKKSDRADPPGSVGSPPNGSNRKRISKSRSKQ